MRLLISLYPIKNPNRSEEILKCLKGNLENNYLEKIIILNEGFNDLEMIKNDKIEVINLNKRPTFNDYFSYFKNNDVNIIANNDILFNNSLSFIFYLKLKANEVLALSRYEMNNKIFRAKYGDSQDTWVFGPNFNKGKCNFDFYLGIPGCDNRIAGVLYSNKNRVYNPAKLIKTMHFHSSNDRNYSSMDRIYGEYLNIKPTNILLFLMERLFLNKLYYKYRKIYIKN
jgi:hypothetical protein